MEHKELIDIGYGRHEIMFEYKEGWVRLTSVIDGVMRVQAGPRRPSDKLNSQVVFPRHNYAKVKYNKGFGRSGFHDELMRLEMQCEPCVFTLRNRRRSLVCKFTIDWDENSITSRHSSEEDEQFFGFGMQFHEFQQRGQHLTIKTTAEEATGGMTHAPDPFFYSTKGYGIYIDDTGYTQFDMCAAKPDEYTCTVPGDRMDMYIIWGPTFKEICQRLVELRGFAAMPPKWGLGFWYRMPSKWNAKQIAEAAQGFREHQIPCDVIGLEPGWQSRSYPCSYVWNPENFPDPAEFVKGMRENGFHINLWEHQWVHPESPVYAPLKKARCFANKQAMGGSVPDFTKAVATDILAEHHVAEHISLGVDGYKLDECDGSDFTGGWFYPDDTKFPNGRTGAQMHNLSGMLYSRAFHEIFNRQKLRSYLLCRANYAGGNREASVIYSDYYDLRCYLRAMVTSGFSGFLWCPELREAATDQEFLRRCQLMFFSPLAMINAWDEKSSLLPWNRNELCEEEFRVMAEERMKLIPYLYYSFWCSRWCGLSAFRALVMDYSDDQQTWGIDDQYLIGPDMMVAPVLEGNERKVYFPEGTWYDYWGHHRYEGPKWYVFTVADEVIPIFVKAGTIMPVGDVMQHTTHEVPEAMTVVIYPDSEGKAEGAFYEDDGYSTRYISGQYNHRRMTWDGATLTYDTARGYRSPIRQLKYMIAGQ